MSNLEQHTDTNRSEHELAKASLRQELLNTCVGEENAMSGADLALNTPVSESTVRDLIGELRREGIPVYSLGSGYFVISNKTEFKKCISRIDNEIATRQKTKQELYSASTND